MIVIVAFALSSTPILNETKNVSFPEIGQIVEVSTGEQMLTQGMQTEVKGVEFTDDFKAVFSFTKGFYRAVKEDGKYIYLHANKYEPYNGYGVVLPHIVIGIDMSVGGADFKVSKSDDRVCYGGNCGRTTFRLTTRNEVTDNLFQQTLIYSGGSQGKIKIGYREFKEDYARPAFSNDLEFDITSSKVIGYKKSRIEVIEADNTHIKYKVLSNFN